MKKYTFYLALVFALFSCTKEQGVPGPAGPQGPAGASGKGSATDTASIVGDLRIYDEFSNPLSDYSGVVVTLIGGPQQLTATTNTLGHYIFSGIATGTYDLTFQKPGYGTMKIFGLSHFGGGTLPTTAEFVVMLQIPVKTAPNTFTLITNNSSSTTFDLVLDTSSLTYVQIPEDFLVFIGRDAKVGPSNYDIVLKYEDYPDGGGGYTVNFSKSFPIVYIPPAITTGTTLYAVAYTYNQNVHIPGQPQGSEAYGLASYYMDPATGKYVYPNISQPSNIVQFVY